MFCLNVALGNISWRLLFKDSDTAVKASVTLTEAWERNTNEMIAINDQFGQTFRTRTNAISGIMTEDLEQTKLAHVEMALHQERTKVLATKMAQTDPGLRAAQGPSPAIISPMGNGRMPFG